MSERIGRTLPMSKSCGKGIQMYGFELRPISDATGQKIRNICVITALMVVMIHIPVELPSGGAQAVFWRVVPKGLFDYLAVPLFFLVSGYLLRPGGAVRSRTFTLLFPYFIWNALWFGFGLTVQLINGTFEFQNAVARAPQAFGLIPWNLPCNGPLWYLKSLFLYVCVAPLVERWLRMADRIGVLSLCIGCLCLSIGVKVGTWTQIFGWTFSINGFAYFAFGLLLRRYESRRLPWSKVYASFLGLAVVAIFFVANATDWMGVYARAVCIFTVPFALYSFWELVPAKKFPVWLTSSSFPLYLMHWPILHLVLIIAGKLGWRGFLMNSVAGSIVQFCIASFMAITMAQISRRWFPRFTYMLFGGR